MGRASSLATASVLIRSSREVGCPAWAHTERTKSVSLLHVTVSISIRHESKFPVKYSQVLTAWSLGCLLPGDGGWGLWSSWTECTRSCGGGVRTRRRECNSPAPVGEGSYCEGRGTEVINCNTNHCPGVFTCSVAGTKMDQNLLQCAVGSVLITKSF